jgi:flagellar basal-body rod protein FlgF
MSDIFSITGIGMLDGQKRLEAVSQNAANASTPGYRRQVAASRTAAQSFDAALANAGAADVPQASTRTSRGVDLREGGLISTGRPLDVAIDGGEHYFGLSDGQRVWLTRAGSFRIDGEGYLVGERGLRVQGANGDVQLSHGDVEVRADGSIAREGVVLASLQLFKPGAGSAAEPGRGSLIGFAQTQPVERGAKVRSGFLEGSNSSANTEVLGLVALTRQYESLVRITQGYDEALGKTIQRLGEI